MIEADAALTGALNSQSVIFASLVNAPGLKVTDHTKDITYDGTTYLTSGAIIGLDNYPRLWNIDQNSSRLEITNADTTFRAKVLAGDIKAGDVTISIAVLSDAGVVVGGLTQYEGIVDSWEINEDEHSSVIALGLASPWSLYEIRGARYYTDDDQQQRYLGDSIFKRLGRGEKNVNWGL